MERKEAIKIIKSHYPVNKQIINEALEVLIPELRESEDERIREAILELVRQSSEVLGKQNQNNMITWLEKQGEQPRYSIGDVLCDKSCTTLNKDTQPNFEIIDIRDGMYICDKGSFPISQQDKYELVAKKIDQKPVKVPKFKVGDFIQFNGMGHYRYTIKDVCGLSHYINSFDRRMDMAYTDNNFELVEQKTTNKHKPKFQNGQWIVWQNKYYMVNDNGCGYELIDQNGLSTSLEYGTVDTSARLWNITKDAKDGDVLAVNKDDVILIFRGIGNEEWNDVIDYYCRYDCYQKEFIVQKDLEFWGYIKDNQLKPATKEQCDTLLKAMADAGYTFDFGKKELKKIEKKSQRMVSAEAKEALYDKPTDEEMKELLRTEYEKGRADTIAEIEKDWSEEDEKRLKSCLNILQPKTLLGNVETINTNWLKSLKERCCPQKHWKPTEEMLEALYRIIPQDVMEKSEDEILLDKLYQGLKYGRILSK